MCGFSIDLYEVSDPSFVGFTFFFLKGGSIRYNQFPTWLNLIRRNVFKDGSGCEISGVVL